LAFPCCCCSWRSWLAGSRQGAPHRSIRWRRCATNKIKNPTNHQQILMKSTSILFAAAVLIPTLASAADHNLGELAKANKIEVFNRTLDQTKADSPQAVFLNAAPNDGLAWITGVELSEGTIELEIKGKNEQSRSFVGIAFHGQDNRVFDAV